jgi:hypothetical protein
MHVTKLIGLNLLNHYVASGNSLKVGLGYLANKPIFNITANARVETVLCGKYKTVQLSRAKNSTLPHSAPEEQALEKTPT